MNEQNNKTHTGPLGQVAMTVDHWPLTLVVALIVGLAILITQFVTRDAEKAEREYLQTKQKFDQLQSP